MLRFSIRMTWLALVTGFMQRATDRANAAIVELETLYDGGRLRAPINGTVSGIFANQGAVVRAGDPILELASEHRYVLAWFPVARYYRMFEGEAVSIHTGANSLTGSITKIGPLARALPKEYQKAFAPTDREQLV
jgi:multidrug resistance efflux pump